MGAARLSKNRFPLSESGAIISLRLGRPPPGAARRRPGSVDSASRGRGDRAEILR